LLTVSKTGDGVGTVSGPGITRRPDFQKPYDPGSNVNLSATIALGLDLRGPGAITVELDGTCAMNMSGQDVDG
jgi:hypothetical protein